MVIQAYCFADLVFEIRMPLPMLCWETERAFLLADDRTPDLVYEIRQEEPGRTDFRSPIRVVEEDGVLCAYMDVSLLPGITVFEFLCGVNAAYLLPKRGRFMLHASYVIHEGQAILFTAPRETGKSTQARFWQEYQGAKIVNEDRVIISRQGGAFYAHGAWATGSAKVSLNESASIRAVVLLGQGTENRVTHPSAGEKLRRLIPQCSFCEGDREEHIRIIDRVIELIEGTAVVSFDCLNHPTAVEELERAI